MKFKFKGDEFARLFGQDWKPGETQDVQDAHAISKLKNHPQFEAVDKEPEAKAEKPAKVKAKAE
jgi:hypothetical protein